MKKLEESDLDKLKDIFRTSLEKAETQYDFISGIIQGVYILGQKDLANNVLSEIREENEEIRWDDKEMSRGLDIAEEIINKHMEEDL